MLIYAIAGLIVALAGLTGIEYLGNRYGRKARFYSMIGIIFVSHLVRVFLPEVPGLIYIYAWMLGACIFLVIGFSRQAMKK
ncbi:MAG: hypothetical protein R3D26_18635 [Cyanobacteriota/Melainabacteria group bacterium]